MAAGNGSVLVRSDKRPAPEGHRHCRHCSELQEGPTPPENGTETRTNFEGGPSGRGLCSATSPPARLCSTSDQLGVPDLSPVR